MLSPLLHRECLQTELRQIQRGRVVGIPLAHHSILPAALLAQSAERMLTQDVRGESVRVNIGLALGIGEQIDLTVSLLEGLANPMVLEPTAPMEYCIYVS